MIRVGFIFASANTNWLGGTSYYRNLFSAVRELPDRRIDPVVLTSSRGVEILTAQFPGLEVIRLPLLDAHPFIKKVRRAAQLLAGCDIPLERALRERNIDVVSHSGFLGKRSAIPGIAWIPDFQELAFPEFFSPAELASRRRNVRNTCRHASTLLLSSEDALSDLRGLQAGEVETAVLPFVANVPSEKDMKPKEELRAKYHVGEKFFHLPNQFWIHKNHGLVIEALARLNRQGRPFEVIVTGNMHDPRQPDHVAALLDRAEKLGVPHLFRPLGVVPYEDLMSFMRHAVAVINPSRFEGWSTTVEESKSMGKMILLSDIAVHREQAPERSAFFSPDDADALAEKMSDAWDRWDADVDSRFVEAAAVRLPARRASFARRYEEIVLATLNRNALRTNADSASVARAALDQ